MGDRFFGCLQNFNNKRTNAPLPGTSLFEISAVASCRLLSFYLDLD
jgi:hypothetical protein